jgi:competence protein ComEA
MRRLLAWLAALRARARASPWMGMAARIVATAAALVVLAWIGRTATASAPEQAPPAAAAEALDAATPLLDAARAEAPAAAAAPTGEAGAATAHAAHGRATPDDPVYVNVANVQELRRLPGVGAKRADAIVSLRQRMGRFHRVEDLMRVKGIGRATLRKWRPLVRLELPEGGPPPTSG